MTCFVCKKPGHVSDNCPVRRFPATSQQSEASARGGQQQQQQQQQQPQQRGQSKVPGQYTSSASAGGGRSSGGASTTIFHQKQVSGRAVMPGDPVSFGGEGAASVLLSRQQPRALNTMIRCNLTDCFDEG